LLFAAACPLVAPEYGNFAKPLKIGPVYDICRAVGATRGRAGGAPAQSVLGGRALPARFSPLRAGAALNRNLCSKFVQ